MYTSINKFKFMGKPNEIIIDRESNRALFQFDENGEFITDNLRVIGKAVGHFDYLEIREGSESEAVEATPEVIEETIDEKEVEKVKQIKAKKEKEPYEPKIYECKKCGEKFDNMGYFLAHTRICKGDEK